MKLNEKKGGRDLEREIKKTNKTFFCWNWTTWKVFSGGYNMRNASGHYCKVELSGSEKKSEREHIRHFRQKSCNYEVSASFTL